MANENIQELKFQVGEAWKGVYSPSTAYGLANVVQDPTGLSIYRSLKSGNVGHPLSNASWWFRIIDMSSIKAESDRIAALNQSIAQDEALRVAAEELRQQHEAERVAAETKRDEAEQARISAEEQRVTKETQRNTAEQNRITAEQNRVSAESARVQAEQARVLAETLRANAEDQRAANEQNRVAAEQQRIERAEQDHQRAESDHATYVDSLGAFDISSYHATDGVLAKYADLTAALGTGGANIPDDLRKGGMSVKFVQSSDNKYIQARCMAQNFTTDVTQWQGVDDEPVEGSNNLAKSGTLARIYDILQVEPVTQTMSESLNGKFINPNTGSVGTYSPFSISNAISVKKGEIVVATMKCNDVVSAIAKVVTLNQSWQNKVTGIDSSDVVDYYYVAESDCELQFTYATSKGISVKVYSSDILKSLNNSVDLINKGYVYRGVATANSTPSDVSNKLFYLALNDGTYTNYGNLSVDAGITILKYDGSSWSKDLLIGVDKYASVGSKKAVQGNGVMYEVMAQTSPLENQVTEITTEIALDGKFISYPNSNVSNYASCAITAPISLNKGEYLIVNVAATEALYVISKKTGDNSYTGLIRGNDDSWNNPMPVIYKATSDNEQIVVNYKKSSGIKAMVVSSILISVEESVLNNFYLSSRIVTNITKLNKINKLIESIKIYPTDINSSLDGFDIKLEYIGFHDPNDYTTDLVVQIRYNHDGSFTTLTNEFPMQSWEKGKTIKVSKSINEIPIIIEITLSNEDITIFPISNVSSRIVPLSTPYSLPKKEIVNPSNNLMDYDKVLANWMVNAGDGTFEEISGDWVLVKWVLVKDMENVIVGANGVAGLTRNIYSYAFYDASKKYISGTTVWPNEVTTIQVPSGAVYMCLTDKNTYQTDKHQINAGSTIKPYDVYKKPYYITKKDELNNDWFFETNGKSSNIIHIGNTDGCDYDEIQAALNAIWDDAETNTYVLIVHPKTTPYAPFSMIRKSFSISYPWSNNIPKNISIIGLDKVNCIIQSNTGDYYHPAAELLANGTIKNLTFRMTNSEHQASSTQGGYAAHIDARTYNDVGYHMIIQDCDFESATGPAIGIGTHKNANLELIGCKFLSTADPTYNPIEGYTNMANWGAVFAHSSTVSEATNQKLSFINCQGESKLGSKSIRISNSGSTTLLVTLMRNIFWATAQSAPVYDLAGTLSYNPMNFGNNIPT